MGASRPQEEEPLYRIAARRALERAQRSAATPTFGRLLKLQAAGAAGDALLALALAGSLFFSIPEAAARDRVALYLVVTMAPFSLVAPVLSRVLDRSHGGLRAALVVASLGRAVLAWLLASRLDTFYLFPLAFGLLVLSRASLVARSALLPTVVPEGRALVVANASLSKVSAAAGMTAVLPGLVVVHLAGARAELVFAALVYAAGALPAMRLPSARGRRDDEERRRARQGARTPTVRRAVVVMTLLRLLVGFVIFHLGFALPREALDALGLGLLVGGGAFGSLFGAMVSSRFKGRIKEEGLMMLCCFAAGGAAMATGRWFSLASAAALVFVFGASAGASKVAFDALVQRDTPEGGRGWAFARFESLLQLGWVTGALVPVVLTIPTKPGVAGAGVAALLVAVSFVVAHRRAATANRPQPPSGNRRGLAAEQGPSSAAEGHD